LKDPIIQSDNQGESETHVLKKENESLKNKLNELISKKEMVYDVVFEKNQKKIDLLTAELTTTKRLLEKSVEKRSKYIKVGIIILFLVIVATFSLQYYCMTSVQEKRVKSLEETVENHDKYTQSLSIRITQ
jgi:uncharacterized membrane protein YvbJ